MENNDWILKDLNIRQDWNKKGMYVGNCSFTNGVKMEVALQLDAEKCSKMITILQGEIIDSAKVLAERLLKSMPVQIEAPKADLEILPNV